MSATSFRGPESVSTFTFLDQAVGNRIRNTENMGFLSNPKHTFTDHLRALNLGRSA